jgi:hypothetical protein
MQDIQNRQDLLAKTWATWLNTIGKSITLDVRIVMQNDIQQGAVNLQVAVVVNECELASNFDPRPHCRKP